jgi:hypothetical protein
MVLANQLGHPADEVLVLEHQELGVEDPRFIDAGAVLGVGAQLHKLVPDILERRAEAPDLLFDLGARHDTMRDLGQRPAHRHGGAHGDARRHADPLQQPLRRRGGGHAPSFCGFRCIS